MKLNQTIDGQIACAFGTPYLDHFAPPIGTGKGCEACDTYHGEAPTPKVKRPRDRGKRRSLFMSDSIWVIMPILAHPEYTRAAIADCLAQSIQTRLLLINQGVEDSFRDELEKIAEEHSDRVLLWSHVPPLPSLAATWNRALDFVWAVGGAEALVVNNDVRLHPRTVELLSGMMGHTGALFVSAVGVTPEQFDASKPIDDAWLSPPDAAGWGHPLSPGGPDFSCFLISRTCHDQFRFDENFTPAFCEDLDYHRRLILAGEGRRIFSVNLPYLHYASTTLKTVKDRGVIDRAIEAGSRTYYLKKWGGPVNQETYFSPFDKEADDESMIDMPDPPATPALQEWVRALAANPPIDDLTRKMLSL